MGRATLIGCCIFFMSYGSKNDGPVIQPEKEKETSEDPLFNNSIASTDIGFITLTDAHAFLSLVYKDIKNIKIIVISCMLVFNGIKYKTWV